MNIVLVGFMGTGKSVVGRRLAKRLGWHFVDVDSLIEVSAGMSIPELFDAFGEEEFRNLERICIHGVMRQDRQVVATGGGAYMDEANRRKLHAGGLVVCLTATAEDIFKRVERRIRKRPLLAGCADPLERIRELLDQRVRIYKKADVTIDTTGMSLKEETEVVWNKIKPHVKP